MSEAEKRRKDRQELNGLLHAIEPAKNEDIARRAISIADYYLIKAENQAKHIQDLEARNSKQSTIEPERKTGRWIKLDIHAHLADHKCTACSQECYVPTCMGEPMYNFCPNCGADMRGEQDG